MRRAANRDGIEPACLAALAAAGATWEQLDLTNGPDLAIGYEGRNYLVELKSTLRAMPSEGQAAWHERWRGQVAVCRSPREVLRLLGAPWTQVVQEAVATCMAHEYRAILGPKPLRRLNESRLKPNVRRPT